MIRDMRKRILLTFFALFLLLMSGVVLAQQTGKGTITGRILTPGSEMLSDWSIRFFDVKTGVSPFSHEYITVPDYLVMTEYDGSFTKVLPEGTYYIMTVKVVTGKKIGPLEEGDIIFPPMDGREPKQYTVRADETTDVGDISGAVPVKKEWIAAGTTGIEGTVLDINGNPVKGRLVFASPKPGARSPLFGANARTGEDGKYIVRVPEGGNYYLRVKGGDKDPGPVTVITGQLTKEVNLQVTR
jgi:hypothetical protein